MPLTTTTLYAVLWTISLLISAGRCTTLCQLSDDVGVINRPSSLTFVIDITSSMKEDIAKVKKSTSAILREVVDKRNVLVQNFVLVPFHDEDGGE